MAARSDRLTLGRSPRQWRTVGARPGAARGRPAGRPWVAWWVDDPADRRLEIDVCLPPESTEAGWRYVDLELDPVLHERDSRVEIEDWDEYEQACRNGWMSADEAELAVSTAEDRAEALRRRDEPWQQRGWQLLSRQT
ncbi:DUF402 domain-containing protein [Micromonospora sp. CPCC 205556]|uniref:DUF402 domain-containing protein n=1 Tax=Micromonospora sp. CPCC 205556 TaxID=3122398 RepID=UPI002FF06F43